jgi:hypothetical protein
MRLWPLLAVLSLLAFVALFILSNNNAIDRLGNLTIWSFGIFLASLAFALASLASVWTAIRGWKREVRGGVRWFSALATAGLLIAALYLAWWGIVGIRTWA